MVCRVELERSILQSWPTNFTSNTKKYKKTANWVYQQTVPQESGIWKDFLWQKQNLKDHN